MFSTSTTVLDFNTITLPVKFVYLRYFFSDGLVKTSNHITTIMDYIPVNPYF